MATNQPTRPWTVQLFAVVALVATVVSFAVDPGSLSFWNVAFTLFWLSLLRAFWDGDRGIWLLFAIVSCVSLIAGVVAVIGDPAAAPGAAWAVCSTALLLSPDTRRWFDYDRGTGRMRRPGDLPPL